MNNPWTKILKQAHSKTIVLESDKEIIDTFNEDPKRKLEHKIHLELLPEPFLGHPNASVILLNLNPGFNENDKLFHKNNTYFKDQSLKNLTHKSNYPFYLLDEKLKESPGYIWLN